MVDKNWLSTLKNRFRDKENKVARSNKYVVLLISPSKGGLFHWGTILEKNLKAIGIKILPITFYISNLHDTLKVFKVIVDMLRSEVRIIHINASMLAWSKDYIFNAFFPFILFILRFLSKILNKRKHWVITLHNIPDTAHYTIKNPLTDHILRFFGEIVTFIYAKTADSLVGLDKDIVNILYRKYKANTIFIPHGVIYEKNKQNIDFPKEAHYNEKNVLLVFGYISPFKEYETLFDAIKIVNKSMKVELIIAGGSHPAYPHMLRTVMRLAKEKGISTIFTGFVKEEEVAHLFNLARIAILPYKISPGTSGVAHIACAFNKPVIASDTPEFYHLNEKGMGILIYKKGDAKDLAEKVLMLLKDYELYDQLVQKMKNYALKNSIEVIARKYVEVYKRLI
jgi:glycosyltransferase involved in cell wall biosynthesis